MPDLNKQWEEEFEDKFTILIPEGPHAGERYLGMKVEVEDLKSFIRSLLAQQREELRKAIENEKVVEAIFPGQSEEKLQMKRWMNEKLDKILALLTNGK